MERMKELLGLMLIGEAAVGLVAPTRHALLWKFGPEGYQAFMQQLARRPGLSRLFYASELAWGIWLATRALEESRTV